MLPMRRLAVLVAVFMLGSTVAAASTAWDVNRDASVRDTVLFIGDSNITRSAVAVGIAFTTRQDGAHLPVFGGRGGMGIRGMVPGQCPAGCDASNYWAIRISNILATVTPSVIVVNLGGTDVPMTGTPTGLGYTNYPAKIDWFLAQLPNVPVLWTNLPCTVWPKPYNGQGCTAINTALANARSRHPNLTVLPWLGTATGHPEYIDPNVAPHYTTAGYTAWAKLVNTALDQRFPAH